MSASAQVVVQRVDEAVNLPSAAISRRGGQSTVTLVKDGKSTTQPVTTGIVGDSTTQIISGVKPGDEVSMSLGSGLSSLGSGSGGSGGSGSFGGAGGGPIAIPGGGGGFGGGGGGGLRRFGGGGG
jgi:macrolide-specific efflux system membrane fusion protein